MAHGFRDDVLVTHGVAGGEDAVAKHALHQGHLLAVEIVVNLARLDACAELIETAADVLRTTLDRKRTPPHKHTSAMILSELQRSCHRALGIRQIRFHAQVGTALR